MFDIPCSTPAYRVEIDQFVADRAALFDVELPKPWQSLLSAANQPRPLLDDLCAAAVAVEVAAQLETDPSASVEDAVAIAYDALAPAARRQCERRRLLRRVNALLLRAQMRAATLPDDVDPGLAGLILGLQAQWEAVTGALEGFARELDAIAAEYGTGLALSASAARERQAKVNACAYGELRRAFVDHHSAGGAPLVIEDQHIKNLVLDGDEKSVGLFSPLRAFTLLHFQFAAAAPDLIRQQLADAFVDAFWLRGDTEPKTVRGRVVLELRAWVDGFDKAHLGRVRYSYDSRSRIEKGLTALANLWLHVRGAGDTLRMGAELQRCLQAFGDADWSPGPSLKPTLLGVDMRCFQGKVECHIPEAFAAEINAFVTLHSLKLHDR